MVVVLGDTPIEAISTSSAVVPAGLVIVRFPVVALPDAADRASTTYLVTWKVELAVIATDPATAVAGTVTVIVSAAVMSYVTSAPSVIVTSVSLVRTTSL